MFKTTKFRILFLLVLLFIGVVFVKWNFFKSVLLQKSTISNEFLQAPLDKLIPKSTTVNLLIDKSDYQLHVFVSDTIVKSFPIVLGGNPIDDKLCEGDSRTPEGVFKIVDKYPHKKWSKFIWVNYPTEDSWKKHKQAKADGVISKDATIGGEIGIHGVPKGTDYMIESHTNWTLGCISLTNKDVDEIYPFINENTVITIQK